MNSSFSSLMLCVSVTLLCCVRDDGKELPSFSMMDEVPSYFPMIEEPVGNEFNADRWDLGKKLFFDPILSVDSSISCASCHKPHLAFADNQSTTPGVQNRKGKRNVPSLSNVAYHPYYTREGGVPTLEMQILVPIQEHNEFDFNIVDISERLMKIPEYIELSRKAYDRDPDHFVITRAIACFERSLVSGRSKYDLFKTTGDYRVFEPDEKLGMDLFFSNRLSCVKCHGGFDFSNYSFENNGLYTEYQDVGRYRLTGKEEDLEKFKVPSLRNVAVTGPYMHDGSLQTLEAVIDHYNKGGLHNPHKSSIIRPLDLSEAEKIQLIKFLNTLTDEYFIENSRLTNN